MDLANLKLETQGRWNHNLFLEHGKTAFSAESPYLKSLVDLTPWEPYEHYMMARLVAAVPGKVGLLHIKFPPDFAEDNRIHTHLYSDRLVTVLEGSGYFLIAPIGEPIKTIAVTVGDRVWMPRGIRHTWYSGVNGLVVESIHNPFFAFDDPDILMYDADRGFVDHNGDGTFTERVMGVVENKKRTADDDISVAA